MDLHFLLGFFTCTLRNWNPRPACGTAFSSVHNISSVCVCVLLFFARLDQVHAKCLKNHRSPDRMWGVCCPRLCFAIARNQSQGREAPGLLFLLEPAPKTMVDSLNLLFETLLEVSSPTQEGINLNHSWPQGHEYSLHKPALWPYSPSFLSVCLQHPLCVRLRPTAN